MNWKFWENKAEPVVAEKKSVLGTSDSLGSFLMFGNNRAETPSSALSLYNDSTAVSIPINKIAEAFAGIQPVIEEIATKKTTTVSPVLELLAQPSAFFDARLFQETIAKDYLITNETEIIALGAQNRPPLELQPISPRNVTINEGIGGLVQNIGVSGNTLAGVYKLTLEGLNARYFEGGLRELKQIRGYSTRNNSLLRGQSLLVSASREARQHILGNDHNISILEKGGRISLVLHYDEDLGTDDFNELKKRVKAEFGGANNAGEIKISTGGGMKVQELSKNNKDMDFAKLQRMATSAVALQYGCPLPLISDDSAKFNNYAIAVLALFDDAVLPLADRLYAGLSQFLLPRFKIDPRKYRITYNILTIPALRSRVLEELKTRKDINIENDNELRATIALDPYTGGEIMLKPATLVPVEQIINPPELVEPTILRDNENDE